MEKIKSQIKYFITSTKKLTNKNILVDILKIKDYYLANTLINTFIAVN